MRSDDVVAVRPQPFFQQFTGCVVALVVICMPLEGVDKLNVGVVAVEIAHHVAADHAHGIAVRSSGEKPRVFATRMAHVEIFEPVDGCVWNARHHLANACCGQRQRTRGHGEDRTFFQPGGQVGHHGFVPHDVLTHAVEDYEEESLVGRCDSIGEGDRRGRLVGFQQHVGGGDEHWDKGQQQQTGHPTTRNTGGGERGRIGGHAFSLHRRFQTCTLAARRSTVVRW